MDTNNLILVAIRAAIKAAEEIMLVYNNSFITETKSDGSPITLADKNAQKTIINELKKLPYPIISEEQEIPEYNERKQWETFWLVDPLDGTKEFVNKNGEFTVNIALIHNKKPIMGVIVAPTTKEVYWGSTDRGAYKIQNYEKLIKLLSNITFAEIVHQSEIIRTSEPKDEIIVLASRSHLDANTHEFLENLKSKYENISIANKGSSLKFCMLAEGKAHLYPRPAKIMEWDTGAGHAILISAGGYITHGSLHEEFLYNKETLRNDIFMAYASEKMHTLFRS